jgi:hypothetical protein
MRPRPPVLVACILALAGAAAGCGGPGLGSLAGKTPDEILNAALAAAEAQSGVHYQLHATSGTQNQVITGDAGQTQGEQQVSTGSNVVDVELIGAMAYVKGNAGGLRFTLGLPAAVASSYANRWISVVSSDTLFQPITQAVTLKGIFGQLKPNGTLHTGSPGTVGGQDAVGVRGGLPGQVASGVSGSAVLYVAVNSPNLPVAFSGAAHTAHQTVTDIGAFSRWGEHLALAPPPGAVAFSSLPKA